MGVRLKDHPTVHVTRNPKAYSYSSEIDSNLKHIGLDSDAPWKPVNVVLHGVFEHHPLYFASNFTRRRRNPWPDERRPKKKPARAPKRSKKKLTTHPKPVSKTLAKGFPQFSLHGLDGRFPGPIGTADTDSPFESQLDVLLPQLELEVAINQLDGWYRSSKVSRQALQERIFHRVGCGEALSKTVFRVINMAMTTLLTIWVVQVGCNLDISFQTMVCQKRK